MGPNKSRGAYSVGAHLVANNGNNEGLFRAGTYPTLLTKPLLEQDLPSAAIMESGNAVGPPWNGTDWHQPMYDRIVDAAGYDPSQRRKISHTESLRLLNNLLNNILQMLKLLRYTPMSPRSPL
jgi:hypothetical protein